MNIEYPNILERNPAKKKELNRGLFFEWTTKVAKSFITDSQGDSPQSVDPVIQHISDHAPVPVESGMNVTAAFGVTELLVHYQEKDGYTPPSMAYSFPYSSAECRDAVIEVVAQIVKTAFAAVSQPNSATNQTLAEILAQFPDANKAFMLGHIYAPILIDGPLSIIQALSILNNGSLVGVEKIISSGELLDFTRRMRAGVLAATANCGWVMRSDPPTSMRDFSKTVVELLQLEKVGRYAGYVDDVCLATHPIGDGSSSVLELLASQFVLPIISAKSSTLLH